MLQINKGQIYLHPLFKPITATMDQKKLEKLENIKNYLENDDITGLNKYIERIKPTVKDDEDFLEIFEEFKNKNYDQALFLTEEIIYDVDDADFVDDFDKVDLDDFNEKDDLLMDEPDGNFEDFTEDFTEDLNEDQFDDLPFYEDKDDDYY
jgi:hypothetical protein